MVAQKEKAMLKRSNIVAAEEDLQTFYRELDGLDSALIRMLECGFRTSSVAFHVIEGSGSSIVEGQRLDWEDKDVFCVPGWTFHEHVNTGKEPAILFSHTDVPVMRSLDLYREEAHPAGRQ